MSKYPEQCFLQGIHFLFQQALIFKRRFLFCKNTEKNWILQIFLRFLFKKYPFSIFLLTKTSIRTCSTSFFISGWAERQFFIEYIREDFHDTLPKFILIICYILYITTSLQSCSFRTLTVVKLIRLTNSNEDVLCFSHDIYNLN